MKLIHFQKAIDKIGPIGFDLCIPIVQIPLGTYPSATPDSLEQVPCLILELLYIKFQLLLEDFEWHLRILFEGQLKMILQQ